VTAQLRDAILRGVYQPGERLRHENLAQRFEVSTMPIREALVALEIEGIVTMIPNRGASVTRYSAAELREIYEIRANLEKIATQKAANRLIRRDIAALGRIYQAMEESRHDATRFTDLNAEFHGTIYSHAQQFHLSKLILSLRARTRHYLRYYVDDPDRCCAAQAEHHQLVHLFEAGKTEEAANFMFHHVYRVGETIARLVENQERSVKPADVSELVAF
jgi:DNA-binding GntR family transcriptional regulator